MKLTDEEKWNRYKNNVIKNNDCWEWQGMKHPNGYGYIKYNKKQISIHRWVFIYLNNYTPEVVMHTCDNRICINPDHLTGGTFLDNNRDRTKKGRNGKKNPSPTCPQGHSEFGSTKKFNNGLTYTTRYCKVCNRQRTKNWRQNVFHDHTPITASLRQVCL